jgi:ATP-dependent Clp protease ATP-binding subunit ClpA
MDMNHFTPRARQVMDLARKEADRLHHSFVGTEHILLGLIALGQGVAVNALGKLGLNLEKVRQEVESGIGTGSDRLKLIGARPYTPRAETMLALADEERRRMNHTYLGTEHLLLGLLREDEGVAAKIMGNHSIDLAELRVEILRELDPNFGQESTGAAENKKLKPVKPSAQKPEPVDSSKSYDVYCSERFTDLIVYRNIRFKGSKTIFPIHLYDSTPVYFELEQADGQTVFVSRHSIIKFCDAGTDPGGEFIPPEAS